MKYDWPVPSDHAACDRFPNYPYWISLFKLCIGDGFPGINSAVELSPVGGKFSPIRPPPPRQVYDKLRYSVQINYFRLSDSDFSSDILKEYMKKKPRAIEFNIVGRILNLYAPSYLFKHRYFWTWDLQNVKGTKPFFYQGIQEK